MNVIVCRCAGKCSSKQDPCPEAVGSWPCYGIVQVIVCCSMLYGALDNDSLWRCPWCIICTALHVPCPGCTASISGAL